MILACVWFVLLMLVSFGIAYTEMAEIRDAGNLPGSFISVVLSAMAILLTWEEIGGVVSKAIWGYFLPHDAGSSIALITAAVLTALAFVGALIAPNACALLLWRSAATRSHVAK